MLLRSNPGQYTLRYDGGLFPPQKCLDWNFQSGEVRNQANKISNGRQANLQYTSTDLMLLPSKS